MGGLKTLFVALLIAAPIAGPARADDPLLREFANCAGRLSAQMEHQWLIGDTESETTQKWRASMISVLEALMPTGSGKQVLAWRIDAKMAHASLLTRATFNDDPEDADWAGRQAEMIIAGCNSLILG